MDAAGRGGGEEGAVEGYGGGGGGGGVEGAGVVVREFAGVFTQAVRMVLMGDKGDEGARGTDV